VRAYSVCVSIACACVLRVRAYCVCERIACVSVLRVRGWRANVRERFCSRVAVNFAYTAGDCCVCVTIMM
jgi:hypothetical protein